MVKQICYNSYVLEDPIVLDGILAVEEMKKVGKIKGHIAGGMGVQSYIPERYHRKTIDLDFSTSWSGGIEDFRGVTSPLRSFLEDKGYKVELKKKHSTYDYVISKGQDSFMIQHRTESKNHFENYTKKTIEREVANHRRMVKEGINYDVLSPEDLVVHKLNRAGIFSKKYGIEKPAFIPLESLFSNLINLRTELVSHFDDTSPEQIAELRLLCDLFDVKCLGEHVSLDKSYFDEVVRAYTKDLRINPHEIYKDLENLQISIK
jgi:hypothetical protein